VPAANATASELTVDGKGCDSFTPTATPTFRARVDAPDVRFECTRLLDDGTWTVFFRAVEDSIRRYAGRNIGTECQA
jgi:hypothetical protein